MLRRLIATVVICGAAVITGPASAFDVNAQSIENISKICGQNVRSQEHAKGIPAHLLSAISLAESGRWDKTAKENVAWPWTVTSGGEGKFYDSREEAMAEVEFLMTEGTRNIDVGCMQINLHYHPGAFDTLSDAFDPKTNTAYAAKFLKSLKDKTGSWVDAAGRYHSATPEKKTRYLKKVLALWNKKRGLKTYAKTPPAPRLKTARGTPVKRTATHIDYPRINRLNAAFKKRRERDPVMTGRARSITEKAERRHKELQAWREAKTRGLDMATLLTMRRAQQKLRQRKKFATMGTSKFPDKRRQQLKKWRDKGIWYGG